MASEAERQAARIALNRGIPAADRQAQIDAVFAPYAGGMPTRVAAAPNMSVAPPVALPPEQVSSQPNFTPGPPPAPAPISLPETTVAPRPGLPGTVPGQGGAPGPGRPLNGPAPWLRNAMAAPPSEGELFENDFNQAMQEQGFEPPGVPRTGEEIRAEAQGDPGLKPHVLGTPETPDEALASNEIGAEAFAAGQQKLEAGEEATQQVLAKHKQQLDQQEAIDAENKTRMAERSKNLEQMESNFRSMADNLKDEPIDSQRLWNSKSTGEKALSRLAIFLGTVGSGLAGTPNLVWDSMQADIDRDIDAQKSSKTFQQSRLAAEGTLYGMARDRFADEATADAAMREAAYGRMAQELQHFEASARTPERKAAIQELRAVAEEKYAAVQQQRRLRQDAYLIEQERLRRASMGRPDPLKEKARTTKLRAGIAQGEADIAKADREIRGGGSAEDQKASRKAEADYQASLQAIDTYEKTNKGLGLGSSWKQRKDAEFAQTQVATTYQNEFLGKSEEDARIAQRTFPQGGTLTSDTAVTSAAAAARAAAKRKRDAAIAGGGGTPQGFSPKTEAK